MACHMSGVEQLWAGWRSAWVESVPSAPEGCVLCRLTQADNQEDAFVVWRGEHAFAGLNLYPYATGHMLIAPNRHVADLEQLTEAEGTSLWTALLAAQHALRVAYEPDGLNVGANVGSTAGASIPGHVHFHAVPRWSGDTNFITATANLKVIPEALDTTYKKLHAAWPRDGFACP